MPLDGLAKDLKKTEATANFSYISPNLCNAGFREKCPEGAPAGPAAADAFLAKVVPEILASPAYKKDGLLIVSFGAADPDPAAPPERPEEGRCGAGSRRSSPPAATDAAPYTPYSVLRSIEELFSLQPAGERRRKQGALLRLGLQRGQRRRLISATLRAMSAQEQTGEPITQEGLEELKAELAELEGPARKAMAARIKVAREEGDLKENAEYHVAKEDQAHLETRIKRLQERLRNAVVVEVSEHRQRHLHLRPHGRGRSTTPKARPTPGPWSARPRRTWPKGASRPSRRSGGR